MSDDEKQPLCPDCEIELLPHNGECRDCEFSLDGNYIDSSDDPASLHDSDWEKTVLVQSELKLYEHSEVAAYSDTRAPVPYVFVSAKYPGGHHITRIPMFTKGLPIDMGHLDEILRVERRGPGENTHPELVAVYGRTNQDMSLKLTPNSEESEIAEYKGRDSLFGTVTDVLWDSDHPKTTDPLNNIDLADKNLDNE